MSPKQLLIDSTRSNLHLRAIINITKAEVEFPTQDEVETELLLKRIYSINHSYNWNEQRISGPF